MTTIVLAVTVAILGAFTLRKDFDGSAPQPVIQTAPIRRIERMPEFEAAMKELGYQAWGYRWQGGVIDGVVQVSASDKSPITYDGKSSLSQLRSLAANDNKPPLTLDSMAGSVLILLGPIPEDKRTNNVPCRVFIEMRSPSGQGLSTSYNTLVDYAGPNSDSGLRVIVDSKWIEKEEKYVRISTTDPDSSYRLLDLRWISEID